MTQEQENLALSVLKDDCIFGQIRKVIGAPDHTPNEALPALVAALVPSAEEKRAEAARVEGREAYAASCPTTDATETYLDGLKKGYEIAGSYVGDHRTKEENLMAQSIGADIFFQINKIEAAAIIASQDIESLTQPSEIATH